MNITDITQREANRVRQDALARFNHLSAEMRARLESATYANAAVKIFEMHLDGLMRSARIDSDLLPIFARELEYVFSQVVEQEYPDLKAANGDLFPVRLSIPEGASTWTQYIVGETGVAKWTAHLGTDRNIVSLEGARIQRSLATYDLDYSYTYDELQAAAMMPGMRLETMMASAARRGHMQLLNDTILWGEPSLGIVGFLNHPNITQVVAADNGGGSTFWVDKTPDQIIADVNALINAQSVLTRGVYPVTDVRISQAEYLLISTTKLGIGDGTLTILDFIQRAHPSVRFDWMLELDARDSAGNLVENAMVAYTNRPEILSAEGSYVFKQFGVQQEGLRFTVPCHSKIGGVRMVVPISVSLMNGIGPAS